MINKKLNIIYNKELEEYFGINIKNIGYSLEQFSNDNCKTYGGLDFHCEITPLHGDKLKQEIYLRVAAINNKDEILATSDPIHLTLEDFYMEALCTTGFCLNYKGLKAIKIYLSKTRH